MNRHFFLRTLGVALMLSGCVAQKEVRLKSPPNSTPVTEANDPYYFEKTNRLTPPEEYVILNKIAYGPTRNDITYLKKIGWSAYLNEQLNPDPSLDKNCDKKIADAKLHIEYGAGGEGKSKWAAVKEDRPLSYLNKGTDSLWKLVDGSKELEWSEKVRPAEELRAATIIRAVYSKWQLQEVLAQFWHNHFNVSTSKDEKIAALLPVYDRDVIRRNCFGNFRQFLEDVATSVSMGYYLDNVVSRASPANENFARELFELHTLGAENYLNNLYNRWRQVPGATSGKAKGYIDEDVYEAARAFTGWTIANGEDNGSGDNFANTGHFYYYEGWHDNYQKRVLGIEFDPNQAPMLDGKRVLDIVAFHPATARRICKKLCVRLVSDNPSDELVKRAAEVWIAERESPDQIKKVVKTILSSPDFLQSFGQKIKNPFELVVSFLRSAQADVKPTGDLFWALSQSGYLLFDYHAPTGHPDFADHWLGTNVNVTKWNMISNLISESISSATFNFSAQHPRGISSSRQIAEYWLTRMFGTLPSKYVDSFVAFMAQNANPDSPPTGDDDDDIKQRLNSMIALMAMLPEFQLR